MEELFSFSKAAPVDYECGSTVSSMTSSTCSSSVTEWSSDNDDFDAVYEQNGTPIIDAVPFIPSRPRIVSSSSMPERVPPMPAKSGLHRRTLSAPLLDRNPATFATMEAQLNLVIQPFGCNHPLVAHLWNLFGNHHFEQGHYKRAMGAYKEEVLAGQDGVHLADAFFNVGRVYLLQGNTDEAIDYFERALGVHEYYKDSLNRNLKVSTAVASIHHHIGKALVQKGLQELAMDSLFTALEIYELANEKECCEDNAQVLNDIGAIYSAIGDKKSALECHQDALKLLQEETSTGLPALAETLSRIASVQKAQYDIISAVDTYKKAIASHRACLALAPSINVRTQLALSLANLADLIVWKRPSQARALYLKAALLNRDAGLDGKSAAQVALQDKLLWL